MELYQLSYFLAVAEHQNFTHAARRLHMAQPALSQQIRNLETELGAPLFIRGRRQTLLTTAGEAFLPQAEALLAMAETAKQTVADVAQLRRGRLLIASVSTLSARWLPPVVRRFRHTHPFVELVLREESSEQVGELVESSVAELGFLQLPANPKQFAIRPLFTEPFVVLAPAGHRLARQASVTIAELSEEPFICFKGRAHQVVRDACRAADFEPRVACESRELETVRALVEAGLGVAVLPRLATAERRKQVAVLRLRDPVLERTLGMITRRGHVLSAAAQAFVGAFGKDEG
jgi:DNA-binding transcriptional LysR family regulator